VKARQGFVFTGVVLLILAGCNRMPKPPEVYPVRGTVRLNGEPVRLGRIHFDPSEPGRGAECWGNIQEDGSFAVRTFKEGDGAAPGVYKVWIEPWSKATNGPARVTPTRIPEKFQESSKSGITVEVQAGQDTLPELDLKS
jgi:hypothetical protein